MTAVTPTLYDRLGSEVGIRTAVDEFYRRVTADPDLAGYFVNTDMTTLRRHQADMLVTATGGPQRYTGRDMATAHAGLGITEDAFDKVVGHLHETLVSLGADNDTILDVLSALAPLKSSIVSA